MVNLNIRVKQFAMPESGERKRNLTTLVLVKRAAVKRGRSRQKVSESSQNWKSVSKITLDLPWRPARAGRQEKREREREEGNRVMRGVEEENQARPATMTSRAFRRE